MVAIISLNFLVIIKKIFSIYSLNFFNNIFHTAAILRHFMCFLFAVDCLFVGILGCVIVGFYTVLYIYTYIIILYFIYLFIFIFIYTCLYSFVLFLFILQLTCIYIYLFILIYLFIYIYL